MLPSWSWVGWTGTIGYYLHNDEPARYSVSFWIQSADDADILERLADVAASTSEKVIPERSLELHIQAYVVKIKFQPARRNPRRVDEATSGVLCFTKPDQECEICAWGGGRHNGRGVNVYHASGRHGDMFDRFWDASLMPAHGSEKNHVTLLIIEWHDKTTQRVAIADAPFESIDRLPKTERTITLR
jgi:hypothetical protein